MTDEFTVDLDDLEHTTQRLRGYQGYLADGLAELERRVRGLLGTSWSGIAAEAYSAAHADWNSGVTDVKEGLAELERAAVRAHGHYAAAMEANRRMTAG